MKDLPETKFYPGCQQELDWERFGLRKQGTRLRSRC
jgi:hypothetical protein